MKKDIVDFVYDWVENYAPENEHGFQHMDPEALKLLKEKLLKFEQFENVKKLNIVSGPAFPSFEGEPLECIENHSGESDKVILTESLVFTKGDDFKFQEVVDLYMITIPPKTYDLENAKKPGVWRKPVDFSTLDPIQSIVINWTNEARADIDIYNEPGHFEEEIIKQVRECLNSKESNLPQIKDKILFRASPRSFKR